MPVYYRCKKCRARHAPPISYAEKLLLDAAATIDLRFECPVQGGSANYNRTDFFWAGDSEEEEGPAPEGTG